MTTSASNSLKCVVLATLHCSKSFVELIGELSYLDLHRPAGLTGWLAGNSTREKEPWCCDEPLGPDRAAPYVMATPRETNELFQGAPSHMATVWHLCGFDRPRVLWKRKVENRSSVRPSRTPLRRAGNRAVGSLEGAPDVSEKSCYIDQRDGFPFRDSDYVV